MTLDGLLALVRGGETELLEFKRSTGERREGASTLCAMLNHRGGCVVFGVARDGQVLGQQVSDHTVEEVAQEIGRIDPPVFPTIDRLQLGDSEMQALVVRANAGPARPYTYKGQAYRRIGNTTVALSRDEYNRMVVERLHADTRWENEPAPRWSVEDIDLRTLSRVVGEAIRRARVTDPGTRDPLTLLRGLGLTRDGAVLRAAVVLFGQAERLEAEMPQCLLRVARFRGTDRTTFIDNRQFHGNVFDLLGTAERFLRESLPVAGRVLPGLFERVDDPLYPPLALREALANAFCHRDYSIGGGSVAIAIYDDRLEVTSSGSLHFGLTAEALFKSHDSLPWNPLIARALYRSGLIESWGRGTLKIAELMLAAGLPSPEIEDAGGCVMVRLRPSRYEPPQRVAHDLSAPQRAVLAALESAPDGLALREVRAVLGSGVPEWAVKDDLGLLKRLGLVESRGHGRGAFWRFVPQGFESEPE
jgi:ATP-dependent DNA helicase RecG